MGEAIAFSFNHAPARSSKPGIEAEDSQASRSNSSSGTS
jgi:hypothetical protein